MPFILMVLLSIFIYIYDLNIYGIIKNRGRMACYGKALSHPARIRILKILTKWIPAWSEVLLINSIGTATVYNT
ncbi:MAG: hypothetical protein U5J96_05100 [Ignavibacteriaceae bacterium]|nr:hypothetical protein [Ignavibacteriaceae bacterium]